MKHSSTPFLNAATRYLRPLPYHRPVGISQLSEELTAPLPNRRICLDELLDGTPARLAILSQDDYCIGSADQMWGFRPYDEPSSRIHDMLMPIGDKICRHFEPTAPRTIYVFYFQLTGCEANCFTVASLVDISSFPACMLEMSTTSITAWRTRQGPDYFGILDLRRIADALSLEALPAVGSIPAADLPITIEGMRDFLEEHVPLSLSKTTSKTRPSAGLIARDPARTWTAEIRTELYEKTLKVRAARQRREANKKPQETVDPLVN